MKDVEFLFGKIFMFPFSVYMIKSIYYLKNNFMLLYIYLKTVDMNKSL